MNTAIKYWPKLGGLMAVLIIIHVLVTDAALAELGSLLWLHLAALMIHQYEEYVYPGGFKEYFNQYISGKNPFIRAPLSDAAILLINVMLGWSAYAASAVLGEQASSLALGLCAITLLNGVLHNGLFILQRRYNPGLISAAFIFLPLGVYIIYRLFLSEGSRAGTSSWTVFLCGVILVPSLIYLLGRAE